MARKSKRATAQVMVYLDERDRALLERLAKTTGLSRTELLRRGLWQLARQTLESAKPGSGIEALIANASAADAPRDLSQRPDHYLYGGGYEAWFAAQKKVGERKPPRKRARLR